MTADPGFRDSLLREGLLIESDVPGLYGSGPRFEAVLERLSALIGELARDMAPEMMRFPPVMPRSTVLQGGYLHRFPHLLGTVHCFHGDDMAHLALLDKLAKGDESWLDSQAATGAVLTPAACYPVYPALAARGAVAPAGHVVDVQSWCFRHEPSADPTRMQAFRLREFVFAGTPAAAVAFGQTWQRRAGDFVQSLGLQHKKLAANDPFFGWQGEIMAALQRDSALKTELQIPVTDADSWTACISFNTHHDHFSATCGLKLEDGSMAHTACVGFGMERLALALFRQHGLGLESASLGL